MIDFARRLRTTTHRMRVPPLYACCAALAGASLVSPKVSAASVDVTLQQLDRSASSGVLGTIDLTLGGTALDWLKPIGADLSFAEKNGATLLTLATQGATFTPGTFTDDGYTYQWNGGDSNSPNGSVFSGSNNTSAGQNVGFRVTFTAPSAGDFILRWYSAANNTQNLRLTGTIGAASDFQQGATNVGTTTGAGGVDEFFWTVYATADAPGQVLTLDLLNSTATTGAIALTGVNVAAVPEPSTAALFGLATFTFGFIRRRSR